MPSHSDIVDQLLSTNVNKDFLFCFLLQYTCYYPFPFQNIVLFSFTLLKKINELVASLKPLSDTAWFDLHSPLGSEQNRRRFQNF